MNHYTVATIAVVILFVILSFVGLVVEPKKKSPGWYALLISICILVVASFILLILHGHEESKRANAKNTITHKYINQAAPPRPQPPRITNTTKNYQPPPRQPPSIYSRFVPTQQVTMYNDEEYTQ